MISSTIRRVALALLSGVIFTVTSALGDMKHKTWNPSPEYRKSDTTLPHTQDDVLLSFYGISMPLGRILLARKGKDYCAIKFTDDWLGETKYDYYTSYEYHYQGDGSGDFTKGDVISGNSELYLPEYKNVFFELGYFKSTPRTMLSCGMMEFNWDPFASIQFQKYELAPTPWTSIKEVNVKDSRVRWYKKNEIEKRISIHIDQIWDRKENQ